MKKFLGKIPAFAGMTVVMSFCSFCAVADDATETLAVAKIAGACGILNQLIDFQSKTKMQGGDEFVARFWKVESARLGQSEEEMMKKCISAIQYYDKLFSSLESASNDE